MYSKLQPSGGNPSPSHSGLLAASAASGELLTSTVTLTNDVYRKLIMMKAAANISDCTIPNLNKLLMFMFGTSGKCYVRNDGEMVMSYVFEFQLSTAELAIVQSSGALPAPIGVTVNIVQQV